jgi:hypothetical protein
MTDEEAMNRHTFSGSCLCGAVRYEITADVLRFYHCHCSRCRKATGTGHASNLIIRPHSVTWQSGEDLVREYKVPDAEHFTNRFCSQCGGRLPRAAADGSIGVIPAGSLDHDIDLTPEGRIFRGSRTSWSCDGRDLPDFDTYPKS